MSHELFNVRESQFIFLAILCGWSVLGWSIIALLAKLSKSPEK